MSREIPERVLALLQEAAQELIADDDKNGLEGSMVFAYSFRDLEGEDWFGALHHGGMTQAIGLHHRALWMLEQQENEDE